MNWLVLERRLLLPLIGAALGLGGYLTIVRPATADTLLASGSSALWAARPADSVRPILQALSLDPGSPERWADMAEALHETGRDDYARYAVEQEIVRAPGLPHVAMRAAGMYFRLNDRVAALRLTHRVLDETTEYDSNVFQTWQRLGGSLADVFEFGVGSNTRAGRGYFTSLLNSGDATVTGAAWAALQARGMVGVDESRFYGEALTALHDYQRAAVIESRVLPQGTWNGGFESQCTGRGLDWLVGSGSGVKANRDMTVRHSGDASMRLEFDGSSREGFNGVSETRAVSGGRWLLRAMVRAEPKDTASAAVSVPGRFGLRIVDAESGSVLAETAKTNVTREWTLIEARLDAGAHARPIRIEIVHPATPASELIVAGTAWIDDVTLTPEASR